MLAPTDVDAFGDPARERQVVQPFHVHRHLHAGAEHHVSLDRARPAGDPLRRVAGAMVGDDQEMVHVMLLHHGAERRVPAGELGVGEARVFLLDGAQSFFAPEAFTIGPQRRSSSATKAPNSFALIGCGTMPSGFRRSRTSGSSSARFTSALRRPTMSSGIFAGLDSENQTVATRSG